MIAVSAADLADALLVFGRFSGDPDGRILRTEESCTPTLSLMFSVLAF